MTELIFPGLVSASDERYVRAFALRREVDQRRKVWRHQIIAQNRCESRETVCLTERSSIGFLVIAEAHGSLIHCACPILAQGPSLRWDIESHPAGDCSWPHVVCRAFEARFINVFSSHPCQMSNLSGPASSRYKGGEEKLGLIVLPFASTPGWLYYATDPLAKGALQSSTLLNHSSLLRKLFEISPNLSYTKGDMEPTMKAIMQQKGDIWYLPRDAQEEQPRVIAARLRTACQHCSQALRKKQRPSWAQTTFEGKAGEKKSLREDSKEDKQPGEEAEEEDKESDHPIAAEGSDNNPDNDDDEDEGDSKWVLWGWSQEL